MKKFKHEFIIFHIIFLLSILFSTANVYAAASGLQTGTPGTYGTKPLNFISCTLEDGSEIDIPNGITLQPKFKFQFDKSVVNMLIWENNSKCFSLYTGSENVPIVVSKVDDTVSFDMRQTIFMHPKKSLEPGKTYYIKISPKLLAKNLNSTLGGSTNGKGVTLSFKTQGQAANPGTNSSSSTAKNTINNASANSPDADQNTSQNSSAVSKMALNSWIELVSGIVIAGWIITEFLIKRKLKKGRNDKPSV
ncbi:MAG: hypothetical protein LIR50_05535 [Bacillota bacterium]|nr:hypothetical protein [Bacillota bacterium]